MCGALAPKELFAACRNGASHHVLGLSAPHTSMETNMRKIVVATFTSLDYVVRPRRVARSRPATSS